MIGLDRSGLVDCLPEGFMQKGCLLLVPVLDQRRMTVVTSSSSPI